MVHQKMGRGALFEVIPSFPPASASPAPGSEQALPPHPVCVLGFFLLFMKVNSVCDWSPQQS